MTDTLQYSKGKGGRSRDIAKSIAKHENSRLGLLLVIVIIVVAALSGGISVKPGNIANILAQSSMRGLVAVGQCFVLLTGGIDISVGAFGAVAAVMGARLMTTSPDLNILGYSAPIAMVGCVP